MKRLVFALALLGFLATPALAQTKATKKTRAKAKHSKVVKACKDKSRPDCAKLIDFGKGDKIGGERPSADGDTLVGIAGERFGSLITLRTSFTREILKSAEGI